MENLTLNQLFNSAISFDPDTIYATVNGDTFMLQWDSEQSCFVDEYQDFAFSLETVYNAPITCIDSKQGYGNTLFVIVKL